MRITTRKKGAVAEDLAIEYLLSRGLKFLGRNYYTRYGEIDLIMLDEEELVFVEVKSSTSDVLQNFTTRKVIRIYHAISHYLADRSFQIYRLDFVGIRGNEIVWIKDIETTL